MKTITTYAIVCLMWILALVVYIVKQTKYDAFVLGFATGYFLATILIHIVYIHWRKKYHIKIVKNSRYGIQNDPSNRI